MYSKVIQLCIYIHSLIFSFFSHIGSHRILEFPVLCRRSLLIIYFIHNGVCKFIPSSCFMPPSLYFPFSNCKIVFNICNSFCFVNKYILSLFKIRLHIWGIYLSLSDLLHLVWQSLDPSMLLGMAFFHSFLWLSNIPLYFWTTYLSLPLLMDI